MRYRLAVLQFARGNWEGARAGLEPFVKTSEKLPRWLEAEARLTLARIYDLGGERDNTLALYKNIVRDYEEECAASAAQLALLTPYCSGGVTTGSR